LLALVEDEAAWIKRRQELTPEALVELVARLKASVCALLKKESPEEGEKFEAAIGKIDSSVDLKSSDSALQLISARKKTDSYVGQFSEHRKTPGASKEVRAKPHWIRSPYDGTILDATGVAPGNLMKDPARGQIMRMARAVPPEFRI
jgi:hypothetical protein